MSGTYQIWIGASPKGTPLIGAVEGANNAEIREQIYPSQMQHRVVARNDSDEVVIVTPTEARTSNMEIIAYFPKADGSMSSR